MKHRMFAIAGVILAWCNSLALARMDEAETPKVDARYLDYATDVVIKDSSTSLTWLLLIALIVVTVAVLFKKTTRTHLD